MSELKPQLRIDETDDVAMIRDALRMHAFDTPCFRFVDSVIGPVDTMSDTKEQGWIHLRGAPAVEYGEVIVAALERYAEEVEFPGSIEVLTLAIRVNEMTHW